MALDDRLHPVEVAREQRTQRLGIRRSPSAVEPVTSQNTTVTVFRTSPLGSGAASGAAHSRQNFARSGFSVPQRSQITDRVYAARISGLKAPRSWC